MHTKRLSINLGCHNLSFSIQGIMVAGLTVFGNRALTYADALKGNPINLYIF